MRNKTIGSVAEAANHAYIGDMISAADRLSHYQHVSLYTRLGNLYHDYRNLHQALFGQLSECLFHTITDARSGLCEPDKANDVAKNLNNLMEKLNKFSFRIENELAGFFGQIKPMDTTEVRQIIRANANEFLSFNKDLRQIQNFLRDTKHMDTSRALHEEYKEIADYFRLIHKGFQPINIISYDLSRLIDEAYRSSRLFNNLNIARVNMQIPETGFVAMSTFDVFSLTKAFEIFFNNALDHGFAGAADDDLFLNVSFAIEGNGIAVDFVNNGNIIADKALEINDEGIQRMFGGYSRRRAYAEGKDNAHGMGCSLAALILKEHGSRIMLDCISVPVKAQHTTEGYTKISTWIPLTHRDFATLEIKKN